MSLAAKTHRFSTCVVVSLYTSRQLFDSRFSTSVVAVFRHRRPALYYSRQERRSKASSSLKILPHLLFSRQALLFVACCPHQERRGEEGYGNEYARTRWSTPAVPCHRVGLSEKLEDEDRSTERFAMVISGGTDLRGSVGGRHAVFL